MASPEHSQGRGARARRAAWRILAVLTLGALAFGWWATRPAPGHRPALHAELVAAAARVEHGGTLELARVVDLDWERAVAFPAYTRLSGLEEGLGFAWSPLSSWEDGVFEDPLLLYDSRQLLVLVSGEEEVVAWCVLNERGSPGSLRIAGPAGAPPGTWPDGIQVWPREEAHFRVTAGPPGVMRRSWVLAPIPR